VSNRREAVARLPRSPELLVSFGPGQAVVDEPLAAAWLLARNHEEQWSAEDVCRSPAAPDDVVGRVKRRIDQLNGRRVELIDRVDEWVAAHLEQDPIAVRHTETYGMVVDRMAIAWVRERRMSNHHWLPAARTQLAELAAAVDTLIADVEARRRSLPAWRSLKVYRSTAEAHS
jgi:hypothetical protein